MQSDHQCNVEFESHDCFAGAWYEGHHRWSFARQLSHTHCCVQVGLEVREKGLNTLEIIGSYYLMIPTTLSRFANNSLCSPTTSQQQACSNQKPSAQCLKFASVKAPGQRQRGQGGQKWPTCYVVNVVTPAWPEGTQGMASLIL